MPVLLLALSWGLVLPGAPHLVATIILAPVMLLIYISPCQNIFGLQKATIRVNQRRTHHI